MKIYFTILSILITTLVALSFINVTKKNTPIKFIIPKGWPIPYYNFKENPITKEGFELGKKLFYDETLSKDSSTSCSSCHQQFAAFATYDHNLSHGIANNLTTRNVPTLQNLAWQNNFMADGSIQHLHQQPKTPITSPIEMGESLENVLLKLNKNKIYKTLFKSAFGNSKISIENMNNAFSQFILMLVSSNSKYDKVMRGEVNFNLAEQIGHEIFKKKCETCHKEPLFTDHSFRNTGLPLDHILKDEGRKKYTNNKNDSLKFRVPSLRNIVLSFPYGHDGRFFTLSNVFDHYRKNIILSSTTDSLLQNKISLSNFEIGQLTSFLYTLTDSTFVSNPMFAPIKYNSIPSFRDKH